MPRKTVGQTITAIRAAERAMERAKNDAATLIAKQADEYVKCEARMNRLRRDMECLLSLTDPDLTVDQVIGHAKQPQITAAVQASKGPKLCKPIRQSLLEATIRRALDDGYIIHNTDPYLAEHGIEYRITPAATDFLNDYFGVNPRNIEPATLRLLEFVSSVADQPVPVPG
jgi:hypothetical protein